MKTKKDSLTFPYSMLEFAICTFFPVRRNSITKVIDLKASEQPEIMKIRYRTLEEADLLIPATAVGSYMPNVLRAAIAGDAEGVKVITRHIRDIPGEPISLSSSFSCNVSAIRKSRQLRLHFLKRTILSFTMATMVTLLILIVVGLG